MKSGSDLSGGLVDDMEARSCNCCVVSSVGFLRNTSSSEHNSSQLLADRDMHNVNRLFSRESVFLRHRPVTDI